MNILFGVHQFFPAHYAGTERYTLHLARQLRDMGHRVHVLTYDFQKGTVDQVPGGELLAKEYIYEGIPVTAFRHSKFPEFGFDLQDESFYRETLEFLQRHDFDLYHCAHPLRIGGSLKAAKEIGIPIVLMLTDYWLLCPLGILMRSDNTLCEGPRGGENCIRYCFSKKGSGEFKERQKQAEEIAAYADCLLSPSRFLISVFRYNSFPGGEHIRYSPHGFDYTLLSAEHSHVLDPERVTIGYIGTLQYHKGVHVLINAFRKVHSSRLRLKIWGGCFHEIAYEAKVRHLAEGDPRIEFCGAYDYNDLENVLKGIDLVVVPSIWYENAPLTITSSHARGIPVIASDIGGMAEMVRDGENGMTFAVGDADALAERLEKIAEQPELVKRFQKAINPPPRLEEEAFRMERLYRSLIASRKGRCAS